MSSSSVQSTSETTLIAGIPRIHASFLSRLRDLAQLGKPRIALLCVFTAAVGLWLAPGSGPDTPRTMAFLVGMGVLVASSNMLNCWIERDIDGRMHRTRDRALPAGRLEPGIALAAALVLLIAALGLIAWAANLTTVALGALAAVCYLGIYTPLKRVSWLAVLVGAVPGALPPLMGWTAATAAISAGGLVLFAIQFFWQLPHFIAISLYLKEDYRRGGLKVLPLVWGDAVARVHLFAYTLLLVAVSLLAVPLAGALYLIAALTLGAGFLALALAGLRRTVGPTWAHRTFTYSLIYLSLLIAVLCLDAR